MYRCLCQLDVKPYISLQLSMPSPTVELCNDTCLQASYFLLLENMSDDGHVVCMHQQPVVSYRMMTASTCSPSWSFTRSLVVSPSLEFRHSSTVEVQRTNCCSNSCIAARGRSGISSHLAPGCSVKCLPGTRPAFAAHQTRGWTSAAVGTAEASSDRDGAMRPAWTGADL